MKILTLSTVIAVALGTAALAEGHSQKDNAQDMKDTLQAGDNASSPAKDKKGGWGNLVGPASTTKGAKSLDDDAK